GDVVKSYKLGNHHKKHGAAACSILIERGLGLVAILALGAISTFFIPPVLPLSLVWLVRIVAVFGVAGVCVAPAVVGVAASVIPKFNGFQGLISSFYESKARVLRVFGLSLVVQLLSAGLVAVAVRALGIPVPLIFCVTAYTVSALAVLLPAINGLGVREVGLVYLFSLVGVSAETAIAVGLTIFCAQALVSLLGLYPLLTKELHVKRVPAS
ncbi:lysylphosphatidylglycerol synthase domain-containing protein, partial [Verrucomicrobiota bacterium]